MPEPGDVLLALVALTLIGSVSLHVVLYKRHVRAVWGWLGLVILSPFLGGALYLLLGVNRVRRVAQRRPIALPPTAGDPEEAVPESLRELAHIVGRTSRRPLRAGNQVALLVDGDQAYPAMLEAIREAKASVWIETYLFDVDPWGIRFIDALRRAHERGVDVRVLIDGVGARYSVPTALSVLRGHGVPAAAFPWSPMPWRWTALNLRNHRKCTLVDEQLAFVGGMNIRAHHVLSDPHRQPTRDMLLRLQGPVVCDLVSVFHEDWGYATGEAVPQPSPPCPPSGGAIVRALPDGPDGDLDVAWWTLLGALACARRSVRIATPYFLPEAELLTALSTTALRGVQVDLLLPAINNLPYMTWAAMAEAPWLVDNGVRIWLAPPPFDHSKLVVVDASWVLVGSSNWDARSLRLNFELDVECYDATLAAQVAELFDARRDRAQRLTQARLAERSALVRLRDRIVRLAKPYL